MSSLALMFGSSEHNDIFGPITTFSAHVVMRGVIPFAFGAPPLSVYTRRAALAMSISYS